MSRSIVDIQRSGGYPVAIPAKITVATDAQVSAPIDLNGLHLCAIVVPAGVVSTWVNFQASADNVNFVAMYDSGGTQISATIAPDRYIPLDPVTFASVQYLKVVMGSAEAADRTLTLIARDI